MTTPYITVTDADTYFSERINIAPWTDASSSDKLKALQSATMIINDLKFIGEKLDTNQLNEFPRYGQDSGIPTAIKEATCEIALQLLNDVDIEQEINALGSQGDSYGNLRTSNIRTPLPHQRNGVPSAKAWMKLLPYLYDSSIIKLVT